MQNGDASTVCLSAGSVLLGLVCSCSWAHLGPFYASGRSRMVAGKSFCASGGASDRQGFCHGVARPGKRSPRTMESVASGPLKTEGPDQVVDDLSRHGDMTADGLCVKNRLGRMLQNLKLVEHRENAVTDNHHPVVA